MDYHPIANIFPLIEGEAFDELVKDIEERGLLETIITYDGSILDGRNRYRACIECGVDPKMKGHVSFADHPDWDEPVWTCPACGDQSTGAMQECVTCGRFARMEIADPVGLVISLNLHRRHLDTSQRSMIGAKLANMRQGTRTDIVEISTMSQSAAADLVNVSRETVNMAKVVIDHGTPELARSVERGSIPVSVAAGIARLPEPEQREIVARGEKEIRAAYKEIKAKDVEKKKDARVEKERAVAEATIAASQQIGHQVYGVIYADPPWRFEPYSRETGMDRAPENHYVTETTDVIARMEVPAADNCVLFLWATAPMLPDALVVLNEWGFTYKSHVIWVKDRIGTGYWARSKHEVLLIGTRGNVPAPSPGEQFTSAIEAPVGRHSEKPTIFAQEIERMFPSIPKLEMFCRSPRAGWSSWGNEVGNIDGASEEIAA